MRSLPRRGRLGVYFVGKLWYAECPECTVTLPGGGPIPLRQPAPELPMVHGWAMRHVQAHRERAS